MENVKLLHTAAFVLCPFVLLMIRTFLVFSEMWKRYPTDLSDVPPSSEIILPAISYKQPALFIGMFCSGYFCLIFLLIVHKGVNVPTYLSCHMLSGKCWQIVHLLVIGSCLNKKGIKPG